MNCPKCNAQNDDNAEVCLICGEPLDTDELRSEEEDKNARLEELKSKRIRKQKNKKRKKVVIICVIIALLLGAAGYGAYTFRDLFFGNTNSDDPVIVTETPTEQPTEEPSEEPTEQPSEEPEQSEEPSETETIPESEEPAVPNGTAPQAPAGNSETSSQQSSAPAAPKATTSSTNKAPATQTNKATAKPAPTAPVTNSPGFSSGSAPQAVIAQGSTMSSALITVTSVEIAPYSGSSVATFKIGNEVYYAYGDTTKFNKGVPGMYTIDATPTADVYYGKPVYSVTKIDSYDANGYILPDSATKILTANDLKGLSKTQLDLARNEIFARHGRKFKRQDVQSYFETKSWYKVNPSYNYSNDFLNLTQIELKNAKFILAYENK